MCLDMSIKRWEMEKGRGRTGVAEVGLVASDNVSSVGRHGDDCCLLVDEWVCCGVGCKSVLKVVELSCGDGR
jgi:hypothetical protein